MVVVTWGRIGADGDTSTLKWRCRRADFGCCSPSPSFGFHLVLFANCSGLEKEEMMVYNAFGGRNTRLSAT